MSYFYSVWINRIFASECLGIIDMSLIVATFFSPIAVDNLFRLLFFGICVCRVTIV